MCSYAPRSHSGAYRLLIYTDGPRVPGYFGTEWIPSACKPDITPGHLSRPSEQPETFTPTDRLRLLKQILGARRHGEDPAHYGEAAGRVSKSM